MKKELFGFLFLIVLFLSACKDICSGVDCNEGVCFEGDCICFQGITGENCNGRFIDFYIGQWEGQLACDCDLEINSPTLFSIISTSDPLKARLAFNGDTLDVRLGDSTATSLSVNELILDPSFVDTISLDNTNIIDSVFMSGQLLNDSATNALKASFYLMDSLGTDVLEADLLRK